MRQTHNEYFVAVGRNADFSGVHRHGPDNGLGQQGNRDPFGRDRPPGRRVHAQEGAAPQVPLRTQRQSILQQREERLQLSDLFHDAEQAGHGQLVNERDEVALFLNQCETFKTDHFTPRIRFAVAVRASTGRNFYVF